MSGHQVLREKVGHPSPARDRVSARRLTILLTVPPIVFSAQLIISYAVASVSCTQRLLPAPVLLAFNIACLIVLALTCLLAVGTGRTVADEGADSTKELHDKGDGRTSFLVQFGLLMSAIFVIASFVELLVILFLGSCAGFPPSP